MSTSLYMLNINNNTLFSETMTFPDNPAIGQLVFLNQILYVYSNLRGTLTWYPLSNQKYTHVHRQNSISNKWEVIHNLNSRNIIYTVYDPELNLINNTTIEFVDSNSFNLLLNTPNSGRIVLFAEYDTGLSDNEILAIYNSILTLDGPNSRLDSDLLDGQHGSYYLDFDNFTNKPNTLSGYGITDAYTKVTVEDKINTAVSNLVNSAPTVLDTLGEFALALANDPNFATTITNQISLKLNAVDYNAGNVLAKLITVDGHNTNLDADLLDGQHGSYYLNWNNFTNRPTTLSGYGITDAQGLNSNLYAIGNIIDNSGFLKKVSNNNWALDTNTYLTQNQNITFDGDVTGTGNTVITLTLSNTGVAAGTYNNSTQNITPFTIDNKGRVISIGEPVTITPTFDALNSTPTTLAGYGITDAQEHSVNLTHIANIIDDHGLLRRYNIDTWGLDTNNYLIHNEEIVLTGDVDGSGTNLLNVILANSGVVPNTYNNSNTKITPFIVDSKGRIINTLSEVTITPEWSSITNTPSTLVGYGITDAVSIHGGSILGNLQIFGDLSVSGTTTTFNTTTITIIDPVFTLGDDVTPIINDRGIEFKWNDGVDAKLGFFGFNNNTKNFVFIPDAVNTSENFSGPVGNIESNLIGNADTATKLKNARNISITGDVSLNINNFDGSTDTTSISTLSDSGVIAGIYNNSSQHVTSFEVDSKGRIINILNNRVITPNWNDVTNIPEIIVNLINLSTNGLLRKVDNNFQLDTSIYLTQNQNINISGDVSGSGNTDLMLILSDSGVIAGTYNNIQNKITPFTVDSKGRITEIHSSLDLIPDWANITNTPTTLVGYGIIDALSINGGTIHGSLVVTGTVIGNSLTASSLEVPRNINVTGDVSLNINNFDGSSNINVISTLSNSGVASGIYNNNSNKLTPFQVDEKGRITNILADIMIAPEWSAVHNKPTSVLGYGITDAQILNNNLTDISVLNSNGYLKRNIDNTWELDPAAFENKLITIHGDVSGSGTNIINLILENTGVTSGIYNDSATSITPFSVDSKGRITFIL